MALPEAFVLVMSLVGFLVLTETLALRLLLSRFPRWFLPADVLVPSEEADALIRREQAKGLLYGFPADEVDFRPSNCDV